MPDWLIPIVSALVGGLFGAGGFAAILRVRADTRVAREARQDDHTLQLINAQNASETEFRDAVIEAYKHEVAARRDLDERLTRTQRDLTVALAERDLSNRQLEKAQLDLSAAHEKIRHLETELSTASGKIHQMETEIAILRTHQKETNSGGVV